MRETYRLSQSVHTQRFNHVTTLELNDGVDPSLEFIISTLELHTSELCKRRCFRVALYSSERDLRAFVELRKDSAVENTPRIRLRLLDLSGTFEIWRVLEHYENPAFSRCFQKVVESELGARVQESGD